MRPPRRAAAGLFVLCGALLTRTPAGAAAPASSRQVDYAAGRLRFDADDAGDAGTLAASVYSLPGSFFDAATANRFLTAVRALDRRRRILVVTDATLGRELAGPARRLKLDLLLDPEPTFSPWPRDPFSLVRAGGDRGQVARVVVLVRPNLQPGREADGDLGRTLAELLPADLDRAWGGVRWSLAPVPFHNGQVLLTPRAAWISLHTLEPRILALLGESRVPVDSFDTPAGIERYLAAAHRAAAELGELYGRPVRFVHPLPETGTAAERTAAITRLGGGAGYDLDSLLTLLPGRAGKPPRALVADVAAGETLLGRFQAADWSALAGRYDLRAADDLPAQLAVAQRAPRPARLGPFLDDVARQLRTAGFTVDRLPLLFVPLALLRDAQGLEHPDFLLTWSNVVVETRRGVLRAEGFASGVPAADAAARKIFTRAGVRLDLLPPLVGSIVRNGGYRCASNHLRRKS